GALKEYFHLAPSDFMYWQLMRHAAARGCKVFDFGRSKQGTGSYDFKRHWGVEPTALPYWYYAPNGQPLPDTSPLNPKLQWAIRIWRGLPLSVTNSLGPRIVRHIPSPSRTTSDQASFSRSPDAVPAGEGRQDPLVPSAVAPGAQA